MLEQKTENEGIGIAQELDAMRDRLTAADRLEAADIIGGIVEDAGMMARCVTLARTDPGAWEAWLLRVRPIRGLSKPVDLLAATVRREARRAHLRLASPAEQTETEAEPNELPEGWTAPAGYRVTRSGVWAVDNDGATTRVSTRPVWPVGYLEDVDGHGHSIRMMWARHGGGYASQVIPATTLLDARGIVSVGGGFPAGSHNARDLVRWIDTATAANQDAIPRQMSAARLGWMQGGFLCGTEWVGPTSDEVLLSEDPAVRQVASALEVRGTWQGWLDHALGPAVDSPDAWLAVYAAVASVLVAPLELPENPAVDWSGSTSQGKTSIQALAASVCGDPREGRLVASWKVSPAGIEARAVVLQHLPLILDDTKKAKRGEDVSAVIYMHSGGSGAIRGKPGSGGRGVGMRVVESWHSMLISSGEQRITSFTADGGARARALCFVGSPLSTRGAADAVKLGAADHHGHLLRRVLLELEMPGAMDAVRTRYDELREHYGSALSVHGAVAGRLGSIVALLDCAREVAEDAGLPAVPQGVDPIGRAFQAAIAGGADADQPAEALRALYDVATSSQGAFYGRHDRDDRDGTPRRPSGGWMGAWDPSDDWRHLAIICSRLREELTRAGFDGGILDRWAERGWLDPAAGMGLRAKVRVDGVPANVYRIRREAFREVLGEGVPADDGG